MRRPGAVDPGAVRQQPTADDRLGQPGALLARCRSGEVAQPGETLQLLSQRPGCATRAKVEILERQGPAADGEAAGEQGVAPRAFAPDMVARHGDELERLLRRPQPRQERPAREPGDDGALGGRAVVAHAEPLSALMLSAYAPGPPRKAAVPATSAVAPAPTAWRAVSGSIPPSTSSTISRSCLAMRLAIASILVSWPEMNFWPPKPGLTVITSTRSRSSST